MSAFQGFAYFGIPVDASAVVAKGIPATFKVVGGVLNLSPVTATSDIFAGIFTEEFTPVDATTQVNQPSIVSVQYSGVCETIAVGAITQGTAVQLAVGGIATKASGDTIGYALTSGATGEIVRFRFL